MAAPSSTALLWLATTAGWLAFRSEKSGFRDLPYNTVQAAYDTNKGKLVRNNLAVGYATSDFVLHSNVNDGSIFGASLYQKVGLPGESPLTPPGEVWAGDWGEPGLHGLQVTRTLTPSMIEQHVTDSTATRQPLVWESSMPWTTAPPSGLRWG